MISKYIVNKYCGRVYCGNGYFNTLDECMKFADDGFCDKAIIVDENGKRYTVKF